MKRGYLALYRKIQDHTFYKEPRIFSKYEAWIDILMEVRHKVDPGEVVIGMSVYLCNYGESLKSVKTWSKRWKWTESKVRRYFILLEKMNQIRTKSEGKTTRLSVINYISYDPKRRDADEQVTRKRRDADGDATTDKNVKKEKKEKKRYSTPASGEQDAQKSFRERIIKYLNAKLSTSYKPNSAKTANPINARMNEGFTAEDFKTVIDDRVSIWINDAEMQKFLRPETLFGSKFEGYLQNTKIQTTPPSKQPLDLNRDRTDEY